VAASKAAMRGATILKASDDKTRELNKHTLMAFSGEAGDTGMSRPTTRSSLGLAVDVSFQCNLQSTYKPTSSFIRCETIRTWGPQRLQASSEESLRRA